MRASRTWPDARVSTSRTTRPVVRSTQARIGKGALASRVAGTSPSSESGTIMPNDERVSKTALSGLPPTTTGTDTRWPG